jgi:CBS domain-containing protein
MTVGELMRTDVITVSPTLAWREAAALLLSRGISAAPVVDDSGHLLGILSEKDLFRGLFPSFKDWIQSPEVYLDFATMESHAADAVGKTVADVMSTRVITAEPSTPVLKIGALMVSSGIHHIPVVEKDILVGIVGRGDMYRAILKQYFGMGKTD